MKTPKLIIAFALFAFAFVALSLVSCDIGGGGDTPDPGDPFVFGEYLIGSTGPGGGKVFYMSIEGFTVYQSANDNKGIIRHYLEAAPANQGTSLTWASEGFDTANISTADKIGMGRKNTALILAKDPNAPAAKACKNYSGGGKTDWFLPSIDELGKLYDNRTHVGNMGTGDYWSSSQDNYNIPYAQGRVFSGGGFSFGGKAGNKSVRAIRAF